MCYRYEDRGLHRDCYGDLAPARLTRGSTNCAVSVAFIVSK